MASCAIVSPSVPAMGCSFCTPVSAVANVLIPASRAARTHWVATSFST